MKKILVAAALAAGVLGGQAVEAVRLYNNNCNQVRFKISSSAQVTPAAGTVTDVSSEYPAAQTTGAGYKFYKIVGNGSAADIPDGTQVWIQAWAGTGYGQRSGWFDSQASSGHRVTLNNGYWYWIGAAYANISQNTQMSIREHAANGTILYNYVSQ